MSSGTTQRQVRQRGQTLEFDEYQGIRRFPVLDGLRAIAIILVFTAHPAYQHFWPAFHGPNGVSVFFVLSGFLITTLAVREESRQGRVDLWAFYTRRLCRIYPLYVVVLVLYCLLLLVVGFQSARRALFVDELPYYSLGLPEHGFFLRGANAPFDGAWSLGIEEKFYLLWPLAFLVPALRSRQARLTVLVACGALSVIIPTIWADGILVAPYVQLAIGCVAALLLHQRATYGLLRQLGETRALVALWFAFLVLQFAVPGSDTGPGDVLYAPYGVIVGLLLVGLVTTEVTWVRWLGARPLVITATLSYALYLIHNFGLNFAEDALPKGDGLRGSLVSTALGIGLAYAFAYFLHRTVERPFIALGRRFTAQRAHNPELHDVDAVTP